MRLLAVILLSLSYFSLVGCTTLQALPSPKPESIVIDLKVGDDVEISATNGKVYALTITALDERAVQGVSSSGKRYEILTPAIASVKVRRVSAWKTVGIVAASIAVVAVALVEYIGFEAGNWH